MREVGRIAAALHDAPPAAARPLGDSGTEATPAADLADAAVLVPLILMPEPHLLLTRRADTLRTHKGQIAFPGGRMEAGETPWEGAVREAEEEIGLARHVPERIGYLDPYVTITRFRVQPCVALVPDGMRFVPDPREVAEVFTVPLAFLEDRRNHEQRSGTVNGRKRFAYAMPYQ
ncbi:MAG: CoA pyrophosphatase, partial [Pseudomonadota bacterium]